MRPNATTTSDFPTCDAVPSTMSAHAAISAATRRLGELRERVRSTCVGGPMPLEVERRGEWHAMLPPARCELRFRLERRDITETDVATLVDRGVHAVSLLVSEPVRCDDPEGLHRVTM